MAFVSSELEMETTDVNDLFLYLDVHGTGLLTYDSVAQLHRGIQTMKLYSGLPIG